MKNLFFLFILLSSFFGRAQYTLIPDANFEKVLIRDGFDNGSIDGKVLTSSIRGIINLNLSNYQINDLKGLQDFVSLEILDCSWNGLTSIDVSKSTSLKEFNCNHNNLSNLDVSNNSSLVKLQCYQNRLINLDISNNLSLNYLMCTLNKITNLDVTKNINLNRLECSQNQLSNLNLSNNINLTQLFCYENNLTNLDLSQNILLTDLWCLTNKLNSLDLSKNKNLKNIWCENNQLTSLNISNSNDLQVLHCFNNKLTNLDISHITSLYVIFCNNNKLTSLNLKNGNNTILTGIDITSNPSLSCIQVDNINNANTRWSFSKDATASYSTNCSKIASNVAPIITATGNQIYCPQTNIKIATSVNIVDPDDTSTNEIYIQISTGYINGQDALTLANPLSHPTITTSWDINAGKLKLYSPTGAPISYLDFIAAIQDVEFNNSSASPSGVRNFSITLGAGQLSYLPSNGHYYEYVASLGINWTKARDEAAARSYYGLQGYLATLTAADEAQLAGAQAPGAGWIGGSDAGTEGTWKWVTGPEAGTTFWIGKNNGTTTAPFYYANWNAPNEPNDSRNNEDYAHITSSAVGNPGTWNDLPEAGDPITVYNYYPKGYIVEYGGMPGDPTLQISASTTITIPKITSTTPNSRCDSGSLTLQATASDGIVSWYTSSTGGTPIATGNSFTIANLTATTPYYVDATNGMCPNARTPITATINTTPTITSTTSASRCDSGTVTLGAVSSAGTINWYNSLTGRTALGTGTSFTTPILAATTTYYVDATTSGCTTPTRTAVIATVNFSPTITSTTPANRCDSGLVTLGAVASAGTINWYDSQTGGTLLGTGTAFTTPSIAATTTYYVDATETSCTTPTRTAITATINITPTITSTTPASRCDSGSVTLGAVSSAGTINWYDSQTGGTLSGTGTTFTTPSITSTTTYYADATASGCTTPTRTPISATINTTPSITSTAPAFLCDSGTATLGATASAGTINWYDVTTGGTSLGTGVSFITPSITSTTTYYVDATTDGCTSPRLPVVATIYPILKMNEEVILCQTETAILDASIPGMNYLWSPSGETTQTIVVSTTGDYSVKISSPFVVSCDSKKNIKVIEHPAPIIKAIIVNENSITVELTNLENYYEYSIDGELFQVSNQFSYIPSGQHTAYVREKNLCNLVQQDFIIFTIAKYFTPNNDGFNDVWEIKEMKNVPNSSALIFDRYGKLIITLNALKYSWDGKYNNNLLPADDYWYILKIDNTKPEIRGHFSLKR